MKKILISLIVVALVAPQIALASWWNPFSWFKKSAPVATQEISHSQPISPEFKLELQTTSTSTSKREETKIQNTKIKISTSSNDSSNSSKKPATPQLVKLSNSQIIQKVKPAVVYISTDTKAGTGMIFTTDGYILTNAHVVSGSSVASISTLNNGSYSGRVVGVNTKLDLAVIKIDASTVLPTVSFDDSDKVMQGDAIFTLGFPFGIAGDVAFKEGTISRRLDDNLEISAEIHPGNSGGPLVDQYGKVIGINSSSFGNKLGGVQVGEVIKFAIPINIAKANIDSLKSGSSDIDPKEEVKQKVGDILLGLTLFLGQDDDSSCGDAVFQETSGNYFSAKNKIDNCVKWFNSKKEKFNKLIEEDVILLNSMDQTIVATFMTPKEFGDIKFQVALSFIPEEYQYFYIQRIINNELNRAGTESWRLDQGTADYKSSLERAKEKDAYVDEAFTRINKVISSMK